MNWPGKALRSQTSQRFSTHFLDNSVAQGRIVSSTGAIIPPSSLVDGAIGLPCERFNLVSESLPQKMVATIQSARASSTGGLYDNEMEAI